MRSFNIICLSLALAAAAAALPAFGAVTAASVLLGGGMALLNARWMNSGLERLLKPEGSKDATFVLMLFLGRLMLIFLVLSVIILTSFLSVLGVVAGLSCGVAAALLDEFRKIVWKAR